MKKIKILLLLSIFTIIFSSNILAEENTEQVSIKSFSRLSKYEHPSLKKSKSYLASDPVESEIYDLIYNAFIKQSDSVYISPLRDQSMKIEKFMEIMQKVLNNHPEMFYVENRFGYTLSGNVYFYYIDSKENIEIMKNELNDKVDSILNEIIKPNMSEFEKELAIHDYIVLNTEYDYENYQNNTVPNDSYNTYGTLMTGVAVCEGYAETFKLLLNKVGIESSIVVSHPMNHAWNIVVIDGKNYQVDVTWNDPVPDRKGQVSYKHLNLTDEQMKKNHNWTYANYPQSNDDRYSVYWDIDSPKKYDNKIYYSSLENDFIYSLDTNLQRKKITNVRAPYFDLAGKYLYFSNYNYGGYLFKTKVDGTGSLEQLNSVNSKDIYREDDYIYYTEKDTGNKRSIRVDITLPEVEEDYSEYVKLDTASIDNLKKPWTINFNKNVDINSVNKNTIYILDENRNKIDLHYSVQAKAVKLTPKQSYNVNKKYTIIVNKSVMSDGKGLKQPILKQFNTIN